MKGRPKQESDRHIPVAILSAAKGGLLEKCHLDLSIREIASNAGTSSAMINYYFFSKNGLLSELVTSFTSDLRAAIVKLEADIESSSGDHTRIIVRGLADLLYGRPEITSIMFVEMMRPQSEIRQAYANKHGAYTISHIADLFTMLMNKGVYRSNLDVAAITNLLLSTLLGYRVMSILWPSEVDVSDQQSVDRLIDSLTRAIEREALPV